MIDIRAGMTFSGKGSLLGVPIIILGVLLVVVGMVNKQVVVMIPGIPLLFQGIVTFMAIRGTLIDPENGRCQPYQDLILFRLGSWVDLSGYQRVTIAHLRERGRPNELGGVAHVNTYLLELHGSGKPLFLREFDTRKEAVEIGRSLATALKIELVMPEPSAAERRR